VWSLATVALTPLSSLQVRITLDHPTTTASSSGPDN
jgi:hypothetical protein